MKVYIYLTVLKMQLLVMRRLVLGIGAASSLVICVYLVLLDQTTVTDSGQYNGIWLSGRQRNGTVLYSSQKSSSSPDNLFNPNSTVHIKSIGSVIHFRKKPTSSAKDLLESNSIVDIVNITQRFAEAAQRVRNVLPEHLLQVGYPRVGVHRRIWKFPVTAQDCSSEVENFIILVPSKPKNFRNREVIRSIWGNRSRLKEMKSSIVFMVGLTNDRFTQISIISESLQFKDIVQMDIVDSYYNLTLKTLGMLTWAARHCKTPKYVAKVDDDNILNLPRILNILNTFHKNYGKFIAGSYQPRTKPKVRGKWFDPVYRKVYQCGRFYPPFHGGPAYFLTNNFLNDLLEKCLELPLIHLEDVFVTGICAGQVKDVHKLKLKGIHLKPISACSFTLPDVTLSHNYKLDNMKPTWDKWQSGVC